jgi:signal transduction histidine kinase
MEQEIKKLEKKLAQEKKAKRILEEEIESKSRKLHIAYEYNQLIFNALGVGVIITTINGEIIGMNKKSQNYFPDIEVNEKKMIWDIFVSNKDIVKDSSQIEKDDTNKDFEFSFNNQIFTVHTTQIEHKKDELIFSIKDITSQKKRENKIRELQEKIIESAYRDGVAENATSVLHNIGNVLTAIINTSSKTDALDQFSVSNSILTKFSDVFNSLKTQDDVIEFIRDDKKGQQFIPLLKEITKNFNEIENVIKSYAKFVDDKCFHIAGIITAQQKFANFKEKHIQEVNLFEIISDCHTMHQDRFENRKIKIKFEINPSVSINIEKVGFAQVVSNIILNAIESIDERFEKDPYFNDKELTITTNKNDEYIILSFQDNGIGIETGLVQKLFKYGFSTKNRSSGFGLHNCSNFMASCDGKIEIISDGINSGATVLLYCSKNVNNSPPKQGAIYE